MTNHQLQRDVNDELANREDADLCADVLRALRPDSIGVRTVNGTVILTGFVASRGERSSAVALAWAVPGVIDVDDRLELFYY